MRTKIERECDVCGNKFMAYHSNSRYCSVDCKKQHVRERIKRLREEKANEEANKKSREYNLNKNLYKLHEYNEKHGTRLSYGQFMAKVKSGELAV